MVIWYDPNQTVLFPELFEELSIPPITSLPDFDNALENLVRIADFGAFIQLNFQGIDKSYSLSLNELRIPNKYLVKNPEPISPIFHLFPGSVMHNINRMKYELRSFFNRNNSIKTPFGYFLFRNYFRKWDAHTQDVSDSIMGFLRSEVGEESYKSCFERIWTGGCNWLHSILRKAHPYLSVLDYSIENYDSDLQRLEEAGKTLFLLDRESPEFLIHSLILKTAHIPLRLSDYEKGISILSTLKTIHLEYLKDVNIESVEDIHHLVQTLWCK